MNRLAAMPSRRSPLRGQRGRATWRWLHVAITLWLTLILAGREHVLSTLGIEIACIHPGEAAGVHAAERDDHHGAQQAQHGARDVGVEDVDGAHAGAVSAAPADLPDDTSASDAEGADDCPVGCTGCACGAAHFSLPTSFLVATRTWTGERLERPTGRDGPWGASTGLERPPRSA